MIRTRAAVVRQSGGAFQFEDITLDEPRPHELVVRIKACGICHTDIALRNGQWVAHFPCVLGHEGAGVVEKVGAEVKAARPGDRVLLSFCSCGSCAPCRKNHPAHCTQFDSLNLNWARSDGSTTLKDSAGHSLGGNFFGQSSLAYHALTHERNVIPVSLSEKELPLFAPLGCGMQAGAGTVMNELRVKKNESILICGAGAVGLSALMAAHFVQAHPIIVVDTVPSRLKLAQELGAHTVIQGQKNRPLALESIVNYIVDTTGHSSVINQSLTFLDEQGKISLLAISADEGEIAPLGPCQTEIDSVSGDSHPQSFLPFSSIAIGKAFFRSIS